MSYDTRLVVGIEGDWSRVEQGYNTWQPRIARLNEEINETERHMLIVTRKVFSAIQSTTHTFESMLRAFGIALPPAWEAIFSAISTTIATLGSIAAAYAAGVVTAPLTAIIGAAAIGLAIFSAGAAIVGQTESSQRLDEAELALRSFSATLSSWARVFD